MPLKLRLPPTVIKKLKTELRAARSREIGGVIVGEFIGNDTFRVEDISVQRDGGTAVHFLRDPVQANTFIKEFTAKHANDYERYNYLGEWHSHPSFLPVPSGEDVETTQGLVESPEVGVNFLVLLICKRTFWRGLQMSVTLFRKGVRPEPAQVELEVVRKFI